MLFPLLRFSRVALGVFGALLASVADPVLAQDSAKPEAEVAPPTEKEPSVGTTGAAMEIREAPKTDEPEPPGIKEYKGRIIAQTMHWQGAPWLQRATREEEEKASVMREQLGVKPGMTVCDLGSGDGYHTLWLAQEVGPKGRVVAVDVQRQMLQMLGRRLADKKLENVELVHGLYWDPLLPPASQDLILLVDVYHEFSHPEHMLKAMQKALKPDGRLVLVEFRTEDPNVPIKPEHKMSKEQMARELLPMGFEVDREFDGLPWQHMIFYKPVPVKETKTPAPAQ
jgi:ubiquinone/menaquinone biosynthesis C-methylase UbiE